MATIPFSLESCIITAEELRQYFYCARIPFLRHIRKIRPIHTYLMEKGTNFHEKVVYAKKSDNDAQQILHQISPKKAGIEQYHDIYLESPSLHLAARLDLFEQDSNEIYAVEIKTGEKKEGNRSFHHNIQLTVQTLLLEEKFHSIITRGKIIYLGDNETSWIEVSIDMKERVLKTVEIMQQNFRDEYLPEPTTNQTKCASCEFYRYCQRV